MVAVVGVELRAPKAGCSQDTNEILGVLLDADSPREAS